MDKKSTAGGYRTGAGRPKGTGKYGELTQPIRVPISLLPKVNALIHNETLKEAITPLENIYPYPKQPYTIPMYSTRVAAGSPSSADDHIENHLDLNQHLVHRPSTTFLVRAEGDSMINVGIHENDILVVDRAIPPTNGKIIIAVVNNELTVKRLEMRTGKVRLIPENPRYQPIEITEEMNFTIWGVVVHAIHSM